MHNREAPIFCPLSRCLIFAGSRFSTDVERRYASIEGKVAAIACALEKYRIFIMGYHSIVVVTDHEPLKELFDDKDLNKITPPPVNFTIYFPAWEMAQRIGCRFPQPSYNDIGPIEHILYPTHSGCRSRI